MLFRFYQNIWEQTLGNRVILTQNLTQNEFEKERITQNQMEFGMNGK